MKLLSVAFLWLSFFGRAVNAETPTTCGENAVALSAFTAQGYGYSYSTIDPYNAGYSLAHSRSQESFDEQVEAIDDGSANFGCSFLVWGDRTHVHRYALLGGTSHGLEPHYFCTLKQTATCCLNFSGQIQPNATPKPVPPQSTRGY